MNITEVFESAEKIKVSIIMQVSLEDYDNSRSNAPYKFHRAIESFKNQIYKNTELIIVADGCNKAYQHYMRSYRQDSNIKFAYYDRTGDPAMYSVHETSAGPSKYYRGLSRNIGLSIASGSAITYMDSDDYLAPNHTMVCMLYYNAFPENSWWLNTSWYDHENVINATQNKDSMIDPNSIESVDLEFLPGNKFKPVKTIDGVGVMAPWLLMHKNNMLISWRDIVSPDLTEDVDFFNRLKSAYPNGSLYNVPCYVRCHHADHWDV